MKYFAKYLPVEGEIKEGDIALDPFNLPYHCKAHMNGLALYDKDEVCLYKLEEYTDKFKKAKLFLCSRDIQVGDEAKAYCPATGIHDFHVYAIDEEEGGGSYIYRSVPSEEGAGWAADSCFKVIGEISPDAVWVKEGDEFAEDQLRLYTLGIPIVHFKCPTCNTFH
jgi:hypothetical protein